MRGGAFTLLITANGEQSKKINRVILALLLGALSSLSVFTVLDYFDFKAVEQSSPLVKEAAIEGVFLKLYILACMFRQSITHASFQLSLLTIAASYGIYRLLPLVDNNNLSWSVTLSITAGFTTVLAESFHKTDSWVLIFGGTDYFIISLLKMAGTAILFFCALTIASYIEIEPKHNKETSRSTTLQTFGITLLVIIICWLPYIVSLYPATVVPDAVDQVAQITGTEEYCRSIQHAVNIKGTTLLNTHHPVFHTLLIGACIKLGGIFHSYNFGFFIYAALQTLCLAATLAYQATYIRSINSSKFFNICVLLFFALNPLFPTWGMTVDKDVYFTIFIWLASITLYRIIRSSTTKASNFILWGVILLFWLVSRNGVIYVIAASLPILVVILWDNKQMMINLILTIITVSFIYIIGIQAILYNSLGVAGSGAREMMSVPFMQTARLLRDHPESITYEDYQVLTDYFVTDNGTLDNLVDAYNNRPTISDDVKALFKNDKSNQLGAYITVWMHGLFSHPDTYLQALFCLDYAWIYPENRGDVPAWIGMSSTDKLNEMLPGTHSPELLKPARDFIFVITRSCSKLPLVGVLFDFSYYTWIYLAALIIMIHRKYLEEIASLSFLYFNYCLIFLSPVACLRYSLFAIMSLPTLIIFTTLNTKHTIKS